MAADPSSPLSFDKDDDDTLDFVTATANLRASAYQIPTKTRFEVKEMAGNIIPAIATTNAIIAGLIIFQALLVLRSLIPSHTKNVFLQGKAHLPIQPFRTCAPSSSCGICRDTYVTLQADGGRVTLGEFVKDVVKGGKGLGWGEEAKVSVYEGGRLLAEPSYGSDDEEEGMGNEGRTLEDLGVGVGKWLTIVDEEDEGDKWDTVHFSICKTYVAQCPLALFSSLFPLSFTSSDVRRLRS
jgi:ubiquitin-like 1-activating enzyme E1 B